MSYEGYVQLICANGHLSGCDAHDEHQAAMRCVHCQAPFTQRHDVDETNCEGEPREIIEVKPAVVYQLKEALNALVAGVDNGQRTLPAVQATIERILANTHPKVLEPARVKFGKIIKYRRQL